MAGACKGGTTSLAWVLAADFAAHTYSLNISGRGVALGWCIETDVRHVGASTSFVFGKIPWRTLVGTMCVHHTVFTLAGNAVCTMYLDVSVGSRMQAPVKVQPHEQPPHILDMRQLHPLLFNMGT